MDGIKDKPLGKIGIYMRLSHDDEKAGESVSIERQRLILKKYAEDHGGTVQKEYVDDGWSGTDFDRPGVKRMLADAQAGKIDTVIVKDLSRFGRNYIRVGQYIDYIFPAYGIRFIAIGDNVDTADRLSASMDMMPIMNVFNEWHAANTSKKIRAVLEASQRSGKYTNWNYPYGYRAGGDENRTAVIDGEAAETVRQIFDMRIRGFSAAKIARILTDGGIPNPSAHYTKLDGTKTLRRCSPRWAPKTVMEILKNPTYIGRTTQHKTTSVSYKNHKTVKLSESEWIIKENAHPPIISERVWQRVQAVNSAAPHGRADGGKTVNPLSGFLVCPDCGKKLRLQSSGGGQKGFVCRTYKDLGVKYCTSHYISANEAERIVLCDIRRAAASAEDENKIKKAFADKLSILRLQGVNSHEKQLKDCKARLKELARLMRSAFEEKVLNRLPESVYSDMCESYAAEEKRLKTRVAELEKAQGADFFENSADAYVKKVKEYLKIDGLSRELCLQLIERITVGEKREGAPREIHIYYKFKNLKN